MTTKVFENISELLTLEGAALKDGRRVKEDDLSIVSDAAILAVDGRIQWTGPRAQFRGRRRQARR